jgi:hypothetical protein
LNLAKFAPAAEPEPAGHPVTTEGETMFIRRTTAEVVQTRIEPEVQATGEFGLPLKVMLGVITYCYARGVFNSGEIAARLKAEPELRKAFGRNLPEEAAIRLFRRKYAGEIEDALETLYLAFPPRDPALPAEPADQPAKVAHQQAGSRVHDAIWTDNKLPGHPVRD